MLLIPEFTEDKLTSELKSLEALGNHKIGPAQLGLGQNLMNSTKRT
jgi:hypothetical protein